MSSPPCAPPGSSPSAPRPGQGGTETYPRRPLAAFRTRPVTHVSWRDTERAHAVTVERPTTVGSAPNANLVVADASVSRLHLEIEPIADGVAVRDLRSTNGIVLHGHRVLSIVLRIAELAPTPPASPPRDPAETIVAALMSSGTALSIAQIVERCPMRTQRLYRVLGDLMRQQRVVRDGPGYRLAPAR